MRFAPPVADEFPLIYDSWARSFRKSPFAGCVPNHLWDQVSRACASDIINRGARVIAAVEDLPDGGRRVMGYSVSEPAIQCLHWLYVKSTYRGLGIGNQLLHETIAGWPGSPKYSHRTTASSGFLRGFTWDPALARVKR